MKTRNTRTRIETVILTVIIAVFPVFTLSCSADIPRCDAIYTDTFDTVTEIIGYFGDRSEFDKICDEFHGIMLEYHKLCDIYNEYDGINNLATVNKNAGVKAVTVDEKLFDLLEYSTGMYRKTDGAFNIMLGSLIRLWEGYRQEGNAIPTENEISEALSHTSIGALVLDRENLSVFISDKDASADLGAIAKGYAVEKVKEYAKEQGYGGILINAGGNICTIGGKPGGKPGGSPWKVGIQLPDNAGEYVTAVESLDGCVVTSGDYQRYYTVDGKRYCHILDGKTGYPAENFRSVSVICQDSALADCLSTALFILPEDAGRKLAEESGVSDVIWIHDKNDLTYLNKD